MYSFWLWFSTTLIQLLRPELVQIRRTENGKWNIWLVWRLQKRSKQVK
jgi:hypothetical protein